MRQDIQVIRSKRRTISMEIKPDLSVIVRTPFKVSEKEINTFICEKSDWLEKHLKEMEQRIIENEKISKLPKFSYEEIALMTEKAKYILPKRAEFFAKRMEVTFQKITIRHQKTRWGSCSAKGNLNFNCLLINCPDEVIDYVVVHELCHLKEMNHSKRFWAEVEKILPSYKNSKEWLKQNGAQLINRL